MRRRSLYLPGTVFIVIALVTVRLHGISARRARGALRDTTNVLAGSTVALGAAVPMVRIFIHSGVNDSGLASMPMVLAASAADATGGAWPLVAPFVGALGSFLAGSTTFSNMMFALVQVSAAEQSVVSPTFVLAAQMIGANAGNMISVPNVVAAAAVVGLLRKGRNNHPLHAGPNALLLPLGGNPGVPVLPVVIAVFCSNVTNLS